MELQVSAKQNSTTVDPMREPRNYEAPLCAEVDGEVWFPESGGDRIAINMAKKICQRCTHQSECAEWGIHNEQFGIWGGLTASNRILIRRQRKLKVRNIA